MLRGQKRPVAKVPQVKQDVRASIHNRFDVEVVDALTGEIKQKAYAENIVLNALWTRLLAPNTYFNHIHYGTGSGTLAATRTSLFTFLGAKAAGEKTLTYDWDNGWISSRKKIQIAPEEHVGSEFKEVGIGYSATAANLVTHALLKDMNGNTITIVKTDTDVINIYATVFVHWDVTGYGGAKVWENALSDFLTVFLVGDRDSTNYDIAHLLVTPGGLPLSSVSGLKYTQFPVTPTYNVSAKTISISKRLGVNDANWPIRRVFPLTQFTRPAVDCEVGGIWYPKTTIVGEAIGTGDGTKTAFKTAHGWIMPGAKVYVDGVEQVSGVTVTTGLPNVKTNFGAQFEYIESTPTTDPIALHPEMSNSIIGDRTATYYNPFYAYGIVSVYLAAYTSLYMSSDGSSWITAASNSGSGTAATVSIAAEHRNKPYIQLRSASGGWRFYREFTADTLPENDVVFATPPATGAVVTIDYDTESVAKDTNHVFDFALTITLGEKVD